MKRIFYINTALILLLCAASSCIKETETGRSKTDGPLPVKLSLHLPSDMRGGASARSIAVEDESTIADVELLAFLDDGGGNFQYTYSAPVESTTNNDGQVEIVATAQGYSGQQIFMVLVNAPSGASSGIVRNMSLAAARQQLLVTEANEWNAASSGDYRPLPMYAETSAATVTAGATLGNYDLVRMLARMDVRLKADVSNFEIVEAHLFNRRTSGQMAFPFDAATWDATNKRVRKTTYPQAAIPGAYKPSYYDSPGYASTPYKADITDDPRGEILRSIYTFEAKGVSEADRLDATAVIVGGKYGGSNDVTYYRVDIVTASTPAGNCSQDILRNHRYDIEIQSFSGTGYGNPEDAFIGGSQLTATVTEWNLATQGVIGDGQWWLMVNRDEIVYDYLGGETDITAQTNYNPVPTQGFPAGIRVDAAEIEYTPAVASGDEWITLTGGNNGDMLRTIKIAAAQNDSQDDRTAKIYVKAGNFTKVINVSQPSNSAMVRIYEYINGQKGAEITSLDFVASGSSQVDARSILVVWRPKDVELNITTSTGGHQSAFVYNAGSDQIITENYSDASGSRVYTIQPGALATSADPFYEQGFTASFSATNDDNETATANLDVRHYNRNGAVEKDNIYLLDGSTDHSFTVKSNVEWTAYYVRQEVTNGTSKQFISAMDGQKVAMDNSASMIEIGSGGHNLEQGGTRIEFSVIDEIGRDPEPEAYLGYGYILVVAGIDESGTKLFSDISESLYCASAVPVGESNCYMIDHANPMPILIPVSQLQYAMNGDAKAGSGFIGADWINDYSKLKVQVLWSDVNEFGTNAAVVKVGAYNGADNVADGMIVIIPGSGTGNAGIILYEDTNESGSYDSGDVIRWSWHIWKSTYFPYAAGTYPSTNPKPSASGTNNIWMDRNLGAMLNAFVSPASAVQPSIGLLYQWGRKDPFPGSLNLSTGNTESQAFYYPSGNYVSFVDNGTPALINLSNSVSNPLTRYVYTGLSDWFTNSNTSYQNHNLWGGINTTDAFLHTISDGKKSVYDPCPEGYRVPKRDTDGWGTAITTWGGVANMGMTNAGYGGYYPLSGFRDYYKAGINDVGSHGYYWSATQSTTYNHSSFYLNLYSSGTVDPSPSATRAYSFSVRCRAE